MSVQTNQYAGFGYFLDNKEAIKALEGKYSEEQIEELFDIYHDSAYNEKIQSVNSVSMIVDGMSAEYIFFGKVFQKSEVYQPLNKVIFEDFPETESIIIKDELLRIFGTDFNKTPNYIVFTHYR